CLSLPSAEITGIHHHTWLIIFLFSPQAERWIAKEAEAGGLLRVQIQPRLQSEFKGSLNYTMRPCLKK
ncbi:hypothetical protein GW7_09717, partial [Heterocephalus glaber]